MNENLDNELFENGASALEENRVNENPAQGDFPPEEFEDLTAQTIIIPEPGEDDASKSNKGLKLFCIILAALIALSGFSLGGYFIGRSSVLGSNSHYGSDMVLNPKPENGKELDAFSIYHSISDSVVGILVYNENNESGEATGVVYSSDGYIVTNDHIYADIAAAKFKVFLNDGKEYDATFVAGDTRSDIAILKITDDVKLSVPEFGDSSRVVTGENVFAVGCPNGYSKKATITSGIVSSPSVRMSITSSYSTNFIQTDSAINPGNSGGALVNTYGQIIGITSSKIAGTAYEGVGFAIPTETVSKIAKSLIENGNVKNRARLGISYYFYNSATAELNNIPSAGLLVAEVAKESSLYGTLKEGDLITRVNDVPIVDDSVILDMLEEASPGDTLLLTVIKETGETVNMSAKLLNDKGSSSYVKSNKNNNKNNGAFDWPEGY